MLLAALLFAAAPVQAQAAPAAAAVAAARFNLDTPVQDIVADEKGRAVLDATLPELRTNAAYETFKAMSLNQLAPYAADKLTPAVLAKVATSLATVK